MNHKLPEAGSYQRMDFLTRYGTQNDKERRLVVTGLAWYVGFAFERPLTDAPVSLIIIILRRPSCTRPVTALIYISLLMLLCALHLY